MYNARIICRKQGKQWKKETASTNKEYINNMLSSELFYHYIAKSKYIRKIIKTYDTLSVYYSNNVKIIYATIYSVYGSAMTEEDVLQCKDI